MTIKQTANLAEAPSMPEHQSPSPAEGFVVTDLLSHLLRRAHFEAEAVFAEHYRQFDITSRQLAILHTVARSPGAQQAAIAQMVGLDVNTFSDLAKRIERKGLIVRERSASDRRAFGLYLTRAGKALIAATSPLTPSYQQRIAERLTAEQQKQLKELLMRMLGLGADS